MYLLLGAGVFLYSCSSSDDFGIDTKSSEARVWNVRLNTAVKDSIPADDATTRAVFVGGHTNRFGSLWDQGDVVHVYQGGVKVEGELYPDEASYFTKAATLTGTLTGTFTEGETLRLYQPSLAMDFTGQTGTLQSASGKTYQYGDVVVETTQNNTLTLSNVNLYYLMNYIQFILSDADTHERLHPTQLVVHAASGGEAVLTKDIEGNVTTGDIVINLSKEDNEYPGIIYAALLNNENASVTYLLKATMENGDVYVGPIAGSGTGYGTYTPNLSTKGTLRACRRFMLKTSAAAGLAIADVADQVFTGYAIEPVLTVTDESTEPATTLTLDTDYATTYTNNINVGEATATITGQADQHTLAATKWIGTKDKAFNIVKATPVIDMDTSTMTLVNNATENTGSRTIIRVFIDNNGNGVYDEGTDYDITALCTVTYSSGDEAVATVVAETGDVTAVGPTTTTITATVAAADNWTSQTKSYTVNVEQEVNTGNGVTNWTDGGTTTGKTYVE